MLRRLNVLWRGTGILFTASMSAKSFLVDEVLMRVRVEGGSGYGVMGLDPYLSGANSLESQVFNREWRTIEDSTVGEVLRGGDVNEVVIELLAHLGCAEAQSKSFAHNFTQDLIKQLPDIDPTFLDDEVGDVGFVAQVNDSEEITIALSKTIQMPRAES